MTPTQLVDEKETNSDSDEIECPWCGAEHGDLFEHNLNDDTTEVTCGKCEREFTLSCSVSVSYTASRRGKDEDRHMHRCRVCGQEDPEPCFLDCDVEELERGHVVGGGAVCSKCEAEGKGDHDA